MDFSLNQDQQNCLLALVRYTIANRLGLQYEKPECIDPVFDKPLGAFVTLHKQGALRGCIGIIAGLHPLRQTIEQMALSAAFSDPRFPPLGSGEFESIDIEISVLSPIEEAKPEDIKVGIHGLIITSGMRRGLLLPQVASENGWTKEEFLSHTCLKAGLPSDTWRKGGYTLEKFSAFVFGEKKEH